MSKILLIQPHRMLQQAMTLFLFPAHQVQVMEAVPESLPAADLDAVIVDAASLRETTGLDAKAIAAVQNWNVPTVWIERGDSIKAPKREKLVIVKTPIEKEVLVSSLAHCLAGPSAAKQNGTPAARDQGLTHTERDAGSSAATENPQVIELVDVVEDVPAQTGRRTNKTK